MKISLLVLSLALFLQAAQVSGNCLSPTVPLINGTCINPPTCPAGQSMNLQSGYCSTCDPHCSQCSGTYCSKCNWDQYVDIQGYCHPCAQPSCQSLNNPEVCTLGPNCLSCEYAGEACTGCDVGYVLYAGNCVDPCVVPGYYPVPDPVTHACPLCDVVFAGCDSCTSSQCVQCQPNWYLDAANQCNTCDSVFDQHCYNCTAQSCLACGVGYYLEGTVCRTCNQDFGFSCAACDNAGCYSCKPPQQPVQDKYYPKAVCLTCTKTGSSDGSHILDLSGNCVTCDSIFGAGCTSCDETGCTALTSLGGYYLKTVGPYTISRPCTDYAPGCLTCNSVTCQACERGTTLVGTICESCDSVYGLNGYVYDNQQPINDCHACSGVFPACLTCNQAGCTNCSSGFGVVQTGLATSTGIWLDYYGTCISCNYEWTGCAVCHFGNTIACDACAPGYYAFGDQSCLASCPSTSYVTTDPGVCHDCTAIYDANCIRCNASQCLTCVPGTYLDPITQGCPSCSSIYGSDCLACTSSECARCTSGFLYNGGCVSDCSNAPGTADYVDSNGLKACLSCLGTYGNCSTCTNATCSVCIPGNYLYEGQCVESCPGGTFIPAAAPAQCRPCSNEYTGCSECTAASCTACDPNAPVYYDPQNVTYPCQPCEMGCAKCTAAGCLECQADHYPSNGTCVPCSTIDPNCVSCSNSSQTCLACAPTWGLQNGGCITCTYLQEGLGCLDCFNYRCTKCPVGTFLDSEGACDSCIGIKGYCGQCNATTCFVCQPGRYMDVNNGCVLPAQCSPGTYASSATYPPSCLACNQILPGCTSCQYNTYGDVVCVAAAAGFTIHTNGYSLRPPALIMKPIANPCPPGCTSCALNICSQCDTGYYISAGQCVPCGTRFSGCQTCNDLTCLSCSPVQPYFYPPLSQCMAGCPLETTAVGAICRACNSIFADCLRCNATQCTGCSRLYSLNADGSGCTFTPCLDPTLPYWLPSDSVCLASCPSGTVSNDTICIPDPCIASGTFFNLTTGECMPCSDPGCLNCSLFGPDFCLACDGGLLLALDPSSPDTTYCTPTCPFNTATDLKGQLCIPCAASCHGCLPLADFLGYNPPTPQIGPDAGTTLQDWFDPTNTLCSECAIQTDLIFLHECVAECPPIQDGKVVRHSSNGTHCVPTCPEGTYPNPAQQACWQCGIGCTNCTQDGCSDCGMEGGVEYFEYMGMCTPICPAGTYANDLTRICESCDPRCTECEGPDSCLGMLSNGLAGIRTAFHPNTKTRCDYQALHIRVLTKIHCFFPTKYLGP